MAAIQFSTELLQDGDRSFIPVSSLELGTRQRIGVKGSVNGRSFRAVATPWRNNQHLIRLSDELLQLLPKQAPLEVELEQDNSPRPPGPLPKAFVQALQAWPGAEQAFAQLSETQRRYFISWIEGSKHPATMARRIERAIRMVVDGVDPLPAQRAARDRRAN